MVLLAGGATCDADQSSTMLMDQAMRQSFFFMYEKRLRAFSPPEKVFEYFASVENPDGSKSMMPADLMRACVPVFAPHGSDVVKSGSLAGESRAGALNRTKVTQGVSKFFKLFDIDGNGTLDFPEYIFFTTLLSIPMHDVTVAFMMFDTDNSGTLDRDEFKTVMKNLRAENRSSSSASGVRPGSKMSGSVEDGGLVELFFGKNGKKLLTLKKFEEFLVQLHREMVQLEFAHYDYKNTGYMSHSDFAMSLVASGNVTEIRKYLARVKSLPEFPGKGVSLAEFQQVYNLRPRLHDMHIAMQSYGGADGVKKQDFARAADKIGGVKLTQTQIDILYHMFDLDDSGTLDTAEFVNLIGGKYHTKNNTSGLSTASFFDCCKSCWTNRSLMEDQMPSPESVK